MPRNWGPLGEEVSSKVELDEPTGELVPDGAATEGDAKAQD